LAEYSSALAVDPITFEVLRQGFVATCNEMATVVSQTAYSTAVNEGKDFAGTLYDNEGHLVSQGEFDLAGFVGVTQLTLPELLRQVDPATMRPGDVYIINDPYTASTHCNDVHLIKPIFINTQLFAFVASTAHWSDVGGVAAGSLNARAGSMYEEGIRIPAVKIFENDELNINVARILFANMRESWERHGDLNAQMAALRAGEHRFTSLVDKYGEDTVRACMRETQDHSERIMRAYLSALPDGEYSATDYVDQDPSTGEPKTIHVSFIVKGDSAVIDLTASDSQANAGINCSIGATYSAVYIAFASILPPMPMNGGVRRALDIRVTKGSILWAVPPAAVSGSVPTTMETLVSTVSQTLSQAAPEDGVGSGSSILNLVLAGYDQRKEFDATYLAYVWTLGGVGGIFHDDGASIVGSPFASTVQIIPCELQERRYPIVWRRLMLRGDSGGPGAKRGGLGCDQVMEMLACAEASSVGNRERFGAPGIFGGGAGAKSEMTVDRKTGTREDLGIMSVQSALNIGDRLNVISAGGGGYGDPFTRPAEDVLEDVIDEYISIESARDVYGVAIVELDKRSLDYRIDSAETEKLRSGR
jgi:N-methylhydantoinase B